ncbi:MAG: transposase [Lachnospiraceae bacterium]|jgi:transposase|nr:transposase [Lachnospiraceae bacterium]
MVEVFGICRYKSKMGFVRVIAQKLPEEQARKAKKRKQRKVSKNQNQITQDTLFCSGWIVVITTLGIEYSGEEILYLYKSRWQVERLFKRLKQNFSITTTSLQLFSDLIIQSSLNECVLMGLINFLGFGGLIPKWQIIF